MVMSFNFEDYKKFCYDLHLKPCRYTSLKMFREYIDGDYDVIFSIVQ